VAERMIPDQSVRAEREQRGDGLCSPLASRAGDTKVGWKKRDGARPSVARVGVGTRRVETPISKAVEEKRSFSRLESRRGKQPKAAARPKLHIDDGCMGGGGDVNDLIIPWDIDDMLTMFKLDMDSYFSGPNGGFTTNRIGIFHYFICAHTHPDTTPESHKFGNTPTIKTGDPRYQSVLFINSIKERFDEYGVSYHSAVTQTFMHEFGRQCNLDNPADEPKYGYKENPDTCMYYGLHCPPDYATNNEYSQDAFGNRVGNEWQYLGNHLGYAFG